MTLLVHVLADGEMFLGADIASTSSESANFPLQPYPLVTSNHDKWKATRTPSVMWGYSGINAVVGPLVEWAATAQWQTWTQLESEVLTEYQKAAKLARESLIATGADPESPKIANLLGFGVMFAGYLPQALGRDNEPGLFIVYEPGLSIRVRESEFRKYEPSAFGDGFTLAAVSWSVTKEFYPEHRIAAPEDVGRFIDALCEATGGALCGPAELWRVTPTESSRVERAKPSNG